MEKSNFLLSQARALLTSKPANAQKQPNRRHFLRTFGLGALAVNPAIGAVKNLASDPFQVELDESNFKVWRNSALAWEISKDFFENQTQIFTVKNKDGWLLNIKNLTFKSIDFTFDLQVTILQIFNQWLIKMEIPALHWQSEMDFIDFLDGIKPISGKALLENNILPIGNFGKIKLNGSFLTSLSPDWSMLFTKEKGVMLQISEHEYETNILKLKPGFSGQLKFYEKNITGSIVEFSDFTDWNKFISAYQYRNKALVLHSESNPNLQLLTGKTEDEPVQLLWANAPGYKMTVKSALKDALLLQDYFFFHQLSHPESPFYLSARLLPKGQWVSNPLGSFQLIRDLETPDFEAFGTGLLITHQLFKPRLKAFHPKLDHAMSATSFYSHPSTINITDTNNQIDLKSLYFEEPPQDTTRKKIIVKDRNIKPIINKPILIEKTDEKKVEKKEEIKEVQIDRIKDLKIDKTPEIQVENERKIKFIPRRPFSIRILRPEDLVWLEVEFRNFKFVSRGKTMIELEDASKSGIITYSFPTQHTLEEAYFETTPMDTSGGNQPITLPARHIRAKKSRLVYEYEAGKPAFELNMQELLDWSKFTLKVHPRAYIKLPNVIAKPIKTPITASKANLIKTENLNTKNNFYQTQIVEKSRHKVDQLSVYDKSVIDAVLPIKLLLLWDPIST